MNPYLPQRIVGGSIQSQGLELISREKKEIVPWEKIHLVCLGLVEEPPMEKPTTMYLKIRETVQNVFSRDRKEEAAQPRQNLYLELFVEDQVQPFRFQSSSINYRSFIEQVDYISENNFKKFLRRLIEHLGDCVLDESLHAFLAGHKSNIKRYSNIYEFQRECQERWVKQKEGNH